MNHLTDCCVIKEACHATKKASSPGSGHAIIKIRTINKVTVRPQEIPKDHIRREISEVRPPTGSTV